MKNYQNKRTTASFPAFRGLGIPLGLSKRAVVLFCALFCATLLFLPVKTFALTTFTDISDFNTNLAWIDGYSGNAGLNNGLVAHMLTGYVQFSQNTYIDNIIIYARNLTGYEFSAFENKSAYAYISASTTDYTCADDTSLNFGAEPSNFYIQSHCGFTIPAYDPFQIWFRVPSKTISYNSVPLRFWGYSTTTNPDFQSYTEGNGLLYFPNVAQVYVQLNGLQYTDTGVAFLPSYPKDCEYTISTSTLSFNATGTISLSPNSPATWYKFSVVANEFDTASTSYFSTSTYLTAGQTYSYSIPVNLPNGAWKISYLLEGSATTTPYVATHYCEATGIGTGLPLPTLKEITSTEFATTEDCSTLSAFSPEKYICELKNLFIYLFVPSQQSINDLKTTISGLSGFAPMNYISATQSFFNDVNAGLSTTSVSFSILGQSGNVAFAFFDKPTTIAGQTSTIKDTIKLFFTFLLVIAFMVWAISFVRKVFR